MTDARDALAAAASRRPAVAVAALVVLGLLVAGVVLVAAPDRRAATPLPPPPPPFLPPPSAEFVPAVPAFSDTPSDTVPRPGTSSAGRPPAPEPTATTVRPPSPPPSRGRPAPTRPPAAPVTGRYRVVQSFADGFIGEVLIVNTTARDRNWTARLAFPGNVGALRTSWVESAPQATLGRDGDAFVWTSGAPVAARSRVALRFHFTRSGSGDRPRQCTVSGSACAFAPSGDTP
ncbi:cellulose-binding protein [Jidongwangia harbinensis]|uniref:cellulose-binding protein n=1 Tax=Jidongwangia harbinensis TaxID=2878561 RepID=UPI001CDA1CA6|nr:cellulose-binding protein [Jidongwangia harbinensis]MCA2217341.1 cellulose-binding protein [Jidongwangia harbinensis]